LLRGEPAKAEVEDLLDGGRCATPATCLCEVVDRLIRRHGVLPEELVCHLNPLIEASLGIVPVENELGWQAGEDRALQYKRNSTDLSLADCVLLACVGQQDLLATSDRALLRVARRLDFKVIPLLDSRGHRAE
jgi:hypothetical protein